MLGAAVEDIAQFLHQEERLDSVSPAVVWRVALWADVASPWLAPPAYLALSAACSVPCSCRLALLCCCTESLVRTLSFEGLLEVVLWLSVSRASPDVSLIFLLLFTSLRQAVLHMEAGPIFPCFPAVGCCGHLGPLSFSHCQPHPPIRDFCHTPYLTVS